MLTILLLCLLMAGCGIEVPAEKHNYIGPWEGVGMSLLITADGTVAYERKKSGGSTSINAPIQEFQGDSFTVGIGLWDPAFSVTLLRNAVSEALICR